jgi:uncharacterized membrane protein
MFHHTPAHVANILLHVIGGTLSLCLGLVAILSPKGLRLHRRAGRLFMYSYSIVVVTAIIGIFVFEFRSFLLVVTILSIYDVYSGYRAIQLRGRQPAPLDIVFSLIAFITPWTFVIAMNGLHQPWAPALTWSILGGLILISTYDILRNILPLRWLQKTWVHEHLYKMMSAYIAIFSTFIGTVLPRYLPWTAIIPSTIGFCVIFGFFIAGPGAWERSRRDANANPG